MKNSIQTIKELYLDYFNNYLTIERFAEDHKMSIFKAKQIVKWGRYLNNHKKKYDQGF